MKKILALLFVLLAVCVVCGCKTKAKRCLCLSSRPDVKTVCRSYEKLDGRPTCADLNCIVTATDDSTVLIEKKCVDAD